MSKTTTAERKFTIVVGADTYSNLSNDVLVNVTEERVLNLLDERGQLTDEIAESIRRMNEPEQSVYIDDPLIFVQFNGVNSNGSH